MNIDPPLPTYGLLVRMSTGLITYILPATCSHEQYHDKVSIRHLNEISINMHTEMSIEDIVNQAGVWLYQPPNQDQSYSNQ